MFRFILLLCIALNLPPIIGSAQFDLEGQVSWLTNYSPDNDPSLFTGLRYIPKATFVLPIDSLRKIDFEASLNLSGTSFIHPFDSIIGNFDINLYRVWIRYVAKQFELRAGLQKIDFGSASILRPLQWFNQIDPRDPLQITNGVFGVLGRYYFLNNANIWMWGLIGNKKARGYDFLESNQWLPEVGTRIQLPVPRGEVALSYHYRTADSRDLIGLPNYEILPENRLGVDGKWDVGVGLWMEYTYVYRSKYFGPLTSNNLITLGTDYTFPIGSGLNLVAEHMILTSGHSAFEVEIANHISAIMINYPIGFFDRISFLTSYNWNAEAATIFLNYEHQFKHITTNFMVYYNPYSNDILPVSDQTNNFGGPGIRLLLVYNHSGIKQKKK